VLQALSICASLTRLDLAESLENEHLPGLIQVLRNTPVLTHLDLCANRLSEGHTLPLEACAHLKWLNLSMNDLSSLPPGISKLTWLTVLMLGGNALDHVPPSLGHLRQLIELDLGSNQLHHIPPWITELTALTLLGLRSASRRHAPPPPGGDDVTVIPDLSSLKLEELDLSDCDLWDGHVPPWLMCMETLESLDLSENHLNNLPLVVGQLPRLTKLSLHNQGPWEGEAPLPGSEGSDEMYLLQGGLFMVPDSVTSLTALQKLSLDGTTIGRWPTPALEGGGGGGGGGDRLQGDFLGRLQYLSVTETGIRDTPAMLRSLTGLMTLNLSTNRLTMLSEDVSALVEILKTQPFTSITYAHVLCS
jgi:internalin A